MPIYEYQCKECGSVFELIEGFPAESPKACAVCGGSRVKRLLSRGVQSRGGSILAGRGGSTCCGREERCERPPCGEGGGCRR